MTILVPLKVYEHNSCSICAFICILS